MASHFKRKIVDQLNHINVPVQHIWTTYTKVGTNRNLGHDVVLLRYVARGFYRHNDIYTMIYGMAIDKSVNGTG